MSVIGVVEDGKVVLPPEMQLPTGTRVRIEPLPSGATSSLGEALRDYIGMADDMPKDLARNLDHYLHGAPRK
jgi:hypothetical protein